MYRNHLCAICAVFIVFAVLTTSDAYEIEPRITNANDSDKHQFPYFAFLVLMTSDGKRHWCGASLIDRQWLITAAHCLRDSIFVEVFMGTANIRRAIDKGKFTDIVTQKNVYIHPNYKDEKLQFDVGLVRLSKPLELTRKIQTIALPSSCESNENVDAIIVGNGRQKVNVKGMASTLQYSYLRTMTYEQCAKAYPSVRFRRLLCGMSKQESSIREGNKCQLI